jgi:hypothetical protein
MVEALGAEDEEENADLSYAVGVHTAELLDSCENNERTE